MAFKLNLHLHKTKKVTEQLSETVAKQVADIDVTSIQNSLLQKNASQLDFVSQFQSLLDDISNAISKELFNSQYKETQLVKKLRDLQSQSSKAKTSDEIAAIRKTLDGLVGQTNASKNFEAAKQIGINALINKK